MSIKLGEVEVVGDVLAELDRAVRIDDLRLFVLEADEVRLAFRTLRSRALKRVRRRRQLWPRERLRPLMLIIVTGRKFRFLRPRATSVASTAIAEIAKLLLPATAPFSAVVIIIVVVILFVLVIIIDKVVRRENFGAAFAS